MKTYKLYESASVKVCFFALRLPPFSVSCPTSLTSYLLIFRLVYRSKPSKLLSRCCVSLTVFHPRPWLLIIHFFLLVQAARVLLRVDDVVQATRKERQQEQGPPPEEPVQE
jgi:hypothetical protein